MLKNGKTWKHVYFLIFFLLLASPGVASEKIIKIAVSEWEPYMSASLPNQGIITKIFKDIFTSAGYRVIIEFKPWKRAFLDTKEGKYNATGIWLRSKEREKIFYYSTPVIKERHVFFHLKDTAFNWETMDDLKSVDILGIIGFYYGPDIADALGKNLIKINRIPHTKQGIQLILSHRATVFLQSDEIGHYALKKFFPKESINQITHHPKAVYINDNYLLFPKVLPESIELKTVFDKKLGQLKASGQFKKEIINSGLADHY